MPTKGYQLDYSKKADTKVLDPASRTQKAKKIRAILEAFSQKPLARLTCLDVGCGGGIMTDLLAPHLERIIGVDIDSGAIAYAAARARSANASFQIADAMNLPFQNQSFDVVIVNHVYEHVPDPRQFVLEISRVLKDDGFCYFPACNKLAVVEPHHKLPFLSWLPRAAANLYVRALRGERSGYYESLQTLWGLKKLLSAFTLHDFTLRVIRDPARFEATDQLPAGSLKSRLAALIAPAVYPLLPTFLWILTKRCSKSVTGNW